MAQSVIGALRVNLSANSAEFDKGLKRANSSLQRFAAAAQRAALIAGTAMAAAAAGIAVGVKRTIAEADKIAKTADKVGVGIEELQKLRHAAELSGVATNTLDLAMQRFSRRVGEAANGSGELKGILEQYNVAVKDGQGRTRALHEIMGDLADVIQRTGSSQERLRIAFKMFDSEGAALVNMLKNGSAGLNEMMAEAEALGFIIDTKTARAAERFNDNLTRLGRVKDGLITRITAGLLPALERLSRLLIDVVRNGDWVARVSSALTAVMDGLTRSIIFVYDNLAVLTRVGAAFIGLKIASSAVGMGLAFVKMARAITLAGLAMKAFHAFSRLSRTGLFLMAGAAAAAIGQFDGLRAKLQELADWAAAVLPDSVPQALVEGLDKLGFNTRALTVELEGLSTHTEDTESALERLGAALSMTGTSAKETGTAVEQIVSKLAMPMERAKDQFAVAAESFKSRIATVEDVALSVANSMDRAFSDFLENGKIGFKEFVASALKDLARLSFQSSVSSLFSTVLGGFSGGGAKFNPIGSLASGHYAQGGRPPIGRLAIVGEEGPELFRPDTAGRIIPNDALAGMDGGHSVVEVRLSEGLEANILERAGNQSVEITRSGIRAFDRDVLPDRVNQIRARPRSR